MLSNSAINKNCNFHSHIGAELSADTILTCWSQPPSADAEASQRLVVNIFCDLASFVLKEHQASHYMRGSYLVMNLVTQTLFLGIRLGLTCPLTPAALTAPEQWTRGQRIPPAPLSLDQAIALCEELLQRIKQHPQAATLAMDCERFIRKGIKATKTTLFDDAYVAREFFYNPPVAKSDGVPEGQPGYGHYAAGVRAACASYYRSYGADKYLELSLNAAKLASQQLKYLGEDRLDGANNLALLHMTNEHHQALSSDNPAAEERLYQVVDLFAKVLNSDAKFNQADAPSLIGIDWLAPEGYLFDEQRTIRIVGNFLDAFNEVACHYLSESRHLKTLVFRPHVGEGCAVFNGEQQTPFKASPAEFILNAYYGISYFLAEQYGEEEKENYLFASGKVYSSGLERYIISEFERYTGGAAFTLGGKQYQQMKQRAEHNTKVMVFAINEWQRTHPKHRLSFRLGHVTHCDQLTARLIRKNNIYVDLNLGSNIRTGAFKIAPGYGAIDYAVAKSQASYNHPNTVAEYNKMYHGETGKSNFSSYIGSGLDNLLRYQCMLLIGDDGAEVEGTRLQDEYQRVADIGTSLRWLNERKDKNDKIPEPGDMTEMLDIITCNTIDWLDRVYQR